MYTAYYHLHHKLFSLLPDSEGLYLGATHREAYSSLEVDTREAYSFGFLANARYDVDYLRAFGQIDLCYRTLGHISQAVAAFRKAWADCGAPRAYNLRVRYLLGRTLEQVGGLGTIQNDLSRRPDILGYGGATLQPGGQSTPRSRPASRAVLGHRTGLEVYPAAVKGE